jgi:parallel beta-helix repeat protein
MNGGGSCGGGIFTNCIFSGNSAAIDGGGAYDAALNCCLVVSNQAAFGGGAFADQNAQHYFGMTLNYLGCGIIGNSARTDGGGMYNTSSGSGTNCLFEGNSASNNGGGLFAGTFSGCTLGGNSAATNGGGAYSASLSGCVISNNTAGASGGGVCNGSTSSSIISSNTAGVGGGGTSYSSMWNSLVTGNSAAYGGGVYMGSPNNSTIAGNRATVAGGGAYFPSSATIGSCIIYDNSAPSGSNYSGTYFVYYNYCCVAPLPPVGTKTISSDPSFVNLSAGNFRLQTNSPCINAGTGYAGPTDLDGRPRFVGGQIDIGAYEFQGPGMGEFIAWLRQCGLPANGCVDYMDSDGDGMNNWQEWVAGTDPTDGSSVLKMLSPFPTNNPTGTMVSWQSVSNRTYFLQRSADPLTQPAFTTIQSNITGQVGTTSCLDTNAIGMGRLFYRVGIP